MLTRRELVPADAAFRKLPLSGDDVHLPAFNRRRGVCRRFTAVILCRVYFHSGWRDLEPKPLACHETSVEHEWSDGIPTVRAHHRDDGHSLEGSRKLQRRGREAQTGDAGFTEPHSLVPVEQSPAFSSSSRSGGAQSKC